MPILNDILDHDVIGPEYRRGVREGIQQGIEQGVQQGELKVLRRLIEKRFGTMPAWAEERLARRTATDLETLGERALDAVSLEDLLTIPKLAGYAGWVTAPTNLPPANS